MPLHLDENHSLMQIKSFSPGFIQVNEHVYTQSIILTPDQVIDHWQPQSIEALDAASLSLIATLKPDVLLLGTGSTHQIVPLTIYGELLNLGIGVEVMETGAACRTFNALTAENRKVVAALIIK